MTFKEFKNLVESLDRGNLELLKIIVDRRIEIVSLTEKLENLKKPYDVGELITPLEPISRDARSTASGN
jgi:hypothetical protein